MITVTFIAQNITTTAYDDIEGTVHMLNIHYVT